MKLSDAIRLGAMLHPQGFGAYVRTSMFNDTVACALGAAALAIGSALDDDDVIGDLDAAFGPLLNTPRRRCPEHGCGVRRVTANVIAHLNDDHRWTREQIADWVETIERAQRGADRGITDVADARPSTGSGVDGGDREQDVACV